MSESKTIPWRKGDVIPQLIIVLITVLYASILLYLLCWALLIIYFCLWVLFIVLNHRLVCRDCKYHGTFCGSFGLGILSIFKPSGKEAFNHKKARNCMIFFLIVLIYPLILLFFLPPHWIWPLIYLILVIITFLLHKKLGCAKCDLTHCSSNPNHKKGKK